MLNTTPGQIALVKKAFSTAGREIGEIFIPAIQSILGFMIELKKSNPIVFKLIIVVGALISVFALLLPVMGAIIGGFQSFLVFIGLAAGAEDALTLSMVRQKVAAALNTAWTYISTAAKVIFTAATAGQTAATEAATAAQTGLNLAFLASPITWVVIAIIALVAVLWYLYNTNESVRNAINWLWASLQQLGGYVMGGLMAAWNALLPALQAIWNGLTLIGSVVGGAILAGLQWLYNTFMSIAAAVWNFYNSLGLLGNILLFIINPIAGLIVFFYQLYDAWNLFASSAEGQAIFAEINSAIEVLQMAFNQLMLALSPVWTALQARS